MEDPTAKRAKTESQTYSKFSRSTTEIEKDVPVPAPSINEPDEIELAILPGMKIVKRAVLGQGSQAKEAADGKVEQLEREIGTLNDELDAGRTQPHVCTSICRSIGRHFN